MTGKSAVRCVSVNTGVTVNCSYVILVWSLIDRGRFPLISSARMGYPLVSQSRPSSRDKNNYMRERAVTKRRTRSGFRAPQRREPRTGRTFQRELVLTELPDPSAFCGGSCLQAARRRARRGWESVLHSCTEFARQVGSSSVWFGTASVWVWAERSSSSSSSSSSPRRATRGGGEERREGQKFPLPCFVTARLVNPQECRRRRDPLSIDRSSTKPCGRSRRGTRTCLQSAPALTDPCGKQLLQSTNDSTIAQQPSGFPPPSEARRSCLPTGCLSICRRCQREKRDRLVVLFVYVFVLLAGVELMARRARFGAARISSEGGDYFSCYCAHICCAAVP